MMRSVLISILLLLHLTLLSQRKPQRKIDSLVAICNSGAPDSIVGRIKADLANLYLQLNDSLQFCKYRDEIRVLWDKKNEPRIGSCYFALLSAYEQKYTSDNAKMIEYYVKSVECCEKAGDLVMLGRRLQRLGLIYMNQGMMSESNKSLMRSLEICEKTNNQLGACYVYLSLGELFRMGQNFPKAMQMYRAGHSLALVCKDYVGIKSSCVNLGVIHEVTQSYDSAFWYYGRVVAMAEKSGKTADLADGYAHLATANRRTGKIKEALAYYEKALVMREKLGDPRDLAISYIQLSDAYADAGTLDKAVDYAKKGLEYSNQINEAFFVEACYRSLGVAYQKMGKWEDCAAALAQYINLHDSLVTDQNNRQAAELETKYENEKKEKEIRLLNKDKEMQEISIQKQKQVTYLIVAIAALLAVTVFFILRGLRQKHRDNKALQEKNEIIANQKDLVEEKQKEIVDSIKYARRIQLAQIPSEKRVGSMLSGLRNPK